ncbi:PDR/VanB family oxidoreductase [Prescottella agglutinans]
MTTANVSSADETTALLTGPMPATLRVESREQVSAEVVALTLADPRGQRLAPWTPGSHIDLILPNGMSRQYSLCGDRWDTYRYRIAVLNEANGRGGSRWIHENLREGDVLGFGGPRNQFPLVPADRYVFIAGGIGITPMIPMIEQAVRTERPWRLVYGGRSRQSMAFLDDLERFGDHVHCAPQDEVGLLDLDVALADVEPGTKVYCCGPTGLLEAVEAACRHLPPYTLHTERFTASAAESSQDRPFTLRLLRSGTDIDVPPGVTALDALADAGIGILSSCRQGTCGTCEVTVVDGVPDHRDSVLSEVDRQAGDCMISCVSRAQTERLVLDL